MKYFIYTLSAVPFVMFCYTALTENIIYGLLWWYITMIAVLAIYAVLIAAATTIYIYKKSHE